MRTISFRIEADKVEALDAIAKNLDRDRSYLLNQAVESYLREQRRFEAMVAEGIAAADRGELVDDEALDPILARWNSPSSEPVEA